MKLNREDYRTAIPQLEKQIKELESAGVKGETSYLHIMYSPVPAPSESQMTKIPDVYIGTYTDFNPIDSEDPSRYVWARFRGQTGRDGDDGHSPTITTEKSGKTTTIKSDGTPIGTVDDGAKGDKGNTGTSVSATYRYYWLGTATPTIDSTTERPPKTGGTAWTLTEPSYTAGSTNNLYFVDCTVYSDTLINYGEISKSSSYEAAKAAQTTAETAQSTADTANAAVSELGNAVGTVEENISNVQSEVLVLQGQAATAAQRDQLDEMNELVRRYIGSEGYISREGGALVIGVGDFKTALTPENIVFYEGDDVVSYISNKKLYTYQTEVLEEQRIGDFVWQLREPNRLSLMYLPKGGQ